MKQKKARTSRLSFTFLSSKKLILGLLLLSIILSVFFAVFKFNDAPPCINADEAAFGYNAYSLLKTGADEYGNTLPVRLKSFGDYKLPLYSYLSVPFIGILGLNDIGVRALNILLAMLFPISIYYLAKELFKKEEIGAISALLVSTSLGKGIVERHAHEALLAALLITLSTYFFIKFLKYEQLRYGLFFGGTLFLSLFSYQSSRLYAAFFIIAAIVYYFYKKKFNRTIGIFFGAVIFVVALFTVTDVLYKPARVENLLLFNSSGFGLKVLELKNEGGNAFFYNKATVGLRDVLFQEMSYFSPQFLASDGDANERFGYTGMSPMTVIEYIFVLVGIYFLFRNRERWRYLILALLLISPFSAALSWADMSLTRSLFLIIILLVVSSYGMYTIMLLAAKRKNLYLVLPLLIFAELIFLFYSWDFYFNHYPQRATVIRAWQCGYKELGDYVKANYAKKDTFYISQKNGEPYIFILFYLNYPPGKYQKEASLTAPDEYGFGQVEKFNKFDFSFPQDAVKRKNVVLVGYPDDFPQLGKIDAKKIKKIIIGNEEIFWIYET